MNQTDIDRQITDARIAMQLAPTPELERIWAVRLVDASRLRDRLLAEAAEREAVDLEAAVVAARMAV